MFLGSTMLAHIELVAVSVASAISPGNIDLPDFDYQRLLQEYSLLDFINDMLLPGGAEDDLVLEVRSLRMF